MYVAKGGIYQFVNLGFSINDLLVVAAEYEKCFGNSLKEKSRFYTSLFVSCVKHIVHKAVDGMLNIKA